MATTLQAARDTVLRDLNDEDETFWSAAEVEGFLRQAYREIARAARCFWDWLYLENLPRGFSYTAPFEVDYLPEIDGALDYGQANFTYADEQAYLTDLIDPGDRVGPANHTMPCEATDDADYLSAAGASTAIPATADLPASCHAVERALWDRASIAVITPLQAERHDSRYELTEGEVYALVTRGDGHRTVRKVRVPAASAETYTITGTGSWGVLRDPTDISAATVTGTWGSPRRMPGMHPIASPVFVGASHTEPWGLPRRPYHDGKNVRVEHWRDGQPVTAGTDVFELPDRVVVACRHYAMSRCLGRNGPAQETRLATHYDLRYRRGLTRLLERMHRQQRAVVGAFGGRMAPSRNGPPRPKLPWNYSPT